MLNRPRCKHSPLGTIHDDVTTDVLGEIGRWQWLVVFFVTLLTVPAVFNHHEDMFLLKPKGIICELPDYYTMLNSSYCHATSPFSENGTQIIKCEKWHIKLFSLIWIKKSWVIFCQDKQHLLSVSMICRLGSAFGCVIFGIISDSFGRRLCMILNVFAEVAFGLVLAFCDSEAWFRLMVFLKALFTSGNIYIGLVIVCEIASNSWRTWLCFLVASPRLLSLVYMVPLANSCPNLETYSFVSSLYSVLLIFILRRLPESPQWYLYNRKITNAEKVIVQAAKYNGVKLCDDFKIRPCCQRAYISLDEWRPFVTIFNVYNIRVVVLCSLFFWFLHSAMWSSLYMKVCKNTFTTLISLGIICAIGAYGFLIIYLSKIFRLRCLLVTNIILTGALTTGVVFMNEINETLFKVFCALALASGAVGYAMNLNITPRLFAINVRASLFGACHAVGQIGTMISYFTLDFYELEIHKVLFVAFIVTLTILVAAVSLVLPDVDGRELPDVIEDMDYFCELSKPRRWATQKTDSPSNEEVEMRIYSFGSTAVSTRSLSGLDARSPAKRILPLGFMKCGIRIVNLLNWRSKN